MRRFLEVFIAASLILSLRFAARAESEKPSVAAIADEADQSDPQALTDLARTYRTAGRYAEAEALYQRVVELTRTGPEADTRAFANSLSNLAVFYHDRGEYGKAEPLYLQALKIRQEGADPDTAAIAATLTNLSQLYEDTHDDQRAAATLSQLMSLWETNPPADDSRAAQIVLRLAQSYEAKGDAANAERSYRLVLSIAWQTDARTPAIIAATRLGEIFQVRVDLPQAEQMYRKALALRLDTAAADSDPLELAAEFSSVALVLNMEGKYAEAAPFYRSALEIRETHLGLQHPDTIQSRQFYALCLRNMGKREEAAQVEAITVTAPAKERVVRKAL